MSRKTLIWIGLFVGSSVGGIVPLLWGSSAFSFSSVILSAAGGIGGILLGYKISKMM
jgi:hypothetical protein